MLACISRSRGYVRHCCYDGETVESVCSVYGVRCDSLIFCSCTATVTPRDSRGSPTDIFGQWWCGRCGVSRIPWRTERTRAGDGERERGVHVRALSACRTERSSANRYILFLSTSVCFCVCVCTHDHRRSRRILAAVFARVIELGHWPRERANLRMCVCSCVYE